MDPECEKAIVRPPDLDFIRTWASTVDVGDKTGYKKIPHLQKAAPPKQEKVKDEITDTDDRQEEFAIVDFKKNGDIEFEVVYDPKDPTHLKLDQMFEDNSYGHFEYWLVEAKQGKTFDAQLMSCVLS